MNVMFFGCPHQRVVLVQCCIVDWSFSPSLPSHVFAFVFVVIVPRETGGGRGPREGKGVGGRNKKVRKHGILQGWKIGCLS